MSELTNGQCNSRALRWKLLVTVSALALLGSSMGVVKASDDDFGRPILWIELGGQFDFLDDNQQKLTPPFFADISKAAFASPVVLEKSPLYSIDGNGKISFQPKGSDWVFSASVRYGRSSRNGYRHQQTNQPVVDVHATHPSYAKFRYAQTTTSNSETHDIFDFMVGKDVGFGALGMNGTSVLSGGLRFAQFQSTSGLAVYSDPDYVNPNVGNNLIGPKYWHSFSAKARNRASFSGLGPAISWNASTPLTDETRNGQISFDWSLNGAILFGRQKSKGYHQTNGKLTTGIANFPPYYHYNTTHYTRSAPHDRSRGVTVPNVGAMAGLSFRYANAKVSFGYRIDEFFGAMDGGIDARKNYNFGDSGPFVTVSMGIGG